MIVAVLLSLFWCASGAAGSCATSVGSATGASPACAPGAASCAPGASLSPASACAPGAAAGCAPSSCATGSASATCAAACGTPAPEAAAALPREDPARGLAPRTGPAPADLGLQDLEPILEPVRAYFRIPAMAVALVRGGQVVAAGAVGTRMAGSGRAVELDDPWHLGSCGKAFTATAAAVLVREGRIHWETTIGDLFPDLTPAARDAYGTVTLRQLLRHRGGMPSRDAAFDDAVARLAGPGRRDAGVHLALSRPPATPPGTAFLYTDVGYTVAGAMLERAASESWEAIVADRVAGPLGLSTLGFGAPGSADAVDAPRGHLLVDGEFRALGVGPGEDLADPVIGPAGTIHLAIAEWARFAAVHLAGARGADPGYLDPASFAVLHSGYQGQDYALGWGLAGNPWGAGRALVHTGSCGAWSALVWVLPETDTAVVAAANYAGAGEALQRAVDRVLGDRRFAPAR